MKRALITGGTGFIGSHLARRLILEGVDVHILARPLSSLWRIQDVASRLTLWRGDLTDFASLELCIRGALPDTVFHLGGDTSGRRWTDDLHELDPSIEINLRGTLNLLRALNRISPARLIRAGGLAEYGDGPAPFSETQRENPISAYGASQVSTTMFLSALSRYLSFPAITLRLAAVYGPGRNEDFFLPSLILHCLEGRDFEMTAGDQLWDLIYIDDVVDALVRASQANIDAGELINIGSGRQRSLREIAELVIRKIGGPSRILAGALPMRAEDIRHLYCRCERAKAILGWEASTDLETGLDPTIAWYRLRMCGASDDRKR